MNARLEQIQALPDWAVVKDDGEAEPWFKVPVADRIAMDVAAAVPADEVVLVCITPEFEITYMREDALGEFLDTGWDFEPEGRIATTEEREDVFRAALRS